MTICGYTGRERCDNCKLWLEPIYIISVKDIMLCKECLRLLEELIHEFRFSE